MEGFVSTVLPYNASGNPACGPFLQGSSWAKREGRFMTPQGLNYLELCKAILSQVNPVVPAKAAKGNTKECGVQVNAKVEKTIQCSLGPKTLFSRDDENPASFKSPKSLDSSMSHGKARCNTPVDRMRFLRPVSIYSPVFDRRICLRKVSDDEQSEAQVEAVEKPERDSDSEADQAELKELNAPPHRAPRGSNFQFLEQRYGFFHCRKCNIRWESAYVWCISGTSKVYYRQLCRKCQVGLNPYKVESVLCKACSKTSCCCEKKQRHINMRRPHRQDLCCRCKGMKLSCDATYSFKYII